MVNYRLDAETGISTDVDNIVVSDIFFIPFTTDTPADDIQVGLMTTKFPYVLNFPPIVDDDNNIIGFDKPINISGASMYPLLGDNYQFVITVKNCIVNPARCETVGNIGFIVAYNPYVKEYLTFCALDTELTVAPEVIEDYAPWNNNVIIPEE